MATTEQRPAPPAAARPPRSRRRQRRRLAGGAAVPYGLLLPALLALTVAMGYPLLRQVVLSFQDYGLAQQFGRPAEWVGLDNYVELLTDRYLWIVTLRSVVFCLVNAALTMALGLAIALLMRRLSTFTRLLVQTGLLLAWAMPVLASLTVWQWLFDSQYGVVNWLLSAAGLDYRGHSWLITPLSFFLVATIVVVWMSVPFVAFTLYAGLTQVSEDTLEAAWMDGAGGWERLRHVMLPAIRPVLLVVGLLQVVWDLRVFTQIYVLQGAGGISRETNVLGTYVYRLGIAEGRFGMAATVALVMLVITVVLTSGYVVAMLRQDEP